MSQEQMCRTLFPEFVAAVAAKDAAKDEAHLNSLLKTARNSAIRHGYSFKDALMDVELPEWCSHEEALRRMEAM